MISRFPIRPIQLAFLMVLIYFLVYSWSIAGLILFAFALINLLRHYELKKVFQTLCCLLCFGAYVTFSHHQSEQAYKEAPAKLTKLQMIPDSLSVNGDLLSFRAESDGQVYHVFYTLKSQEEQSFFQKLDKTIVLEVDAQTEKAQGKRNFAGFDYQTYLKHEGIYRIVRLELIKEMRLAKNMSVIDVLHDWRRKAIVSIQENFPAPMCHYMTGLLFGYLDKSFDEMSSLYSSLGIIHLFALSGMQVGFFLGIFRFFFLRIGLDRDLVGLIQIPFSLLYAGLTGFSVSVVRSLVQSAFSNLGIKGMDNFAVTLMFLFFIMPHFLLTTGGVLSFAYAFVLSFIDFEHLSSYKKLMAENLAISLGILPLLIYYFSSFQPFSVLLTAVFSIAFDLLILPLLSLVFILSPIIKIYAINDLFIFLESVVTWTEKLLGTPFVFGKPSLLILVLMLICLGLLYDFYGKKGLRLTLCCFLALLFFICKHPLQNEVTILDVGQGDSILLRDIKGKTILIDVGGKVSFSAVQSWQKRSSDSNAERTSIPYLKSRGIGKIDQLVLTHTDTDHIGDMEALAKYFKIGEVLVSSGSLTKPDFVSRLERLGVKVRVVTAGERLPIMMTYLQVLYPYKTGDGGNNDSIVLYGNLLGKRFLFTGDLEAEGETELLVNYPNLKIDILKAGHHGSKGSSSPAFLRQLGADIALISAGQNNRYRHPHQETLDRFEKEKMTVYRTDQEGAIRFIGWKQWRVETVR